MVAISEIFFSWLSLISMQMLITIYSMKTMTSRKKIMDKYYNYTSTQRVMLIIYVYAL